MRREHRRPPILKFGLLVQMALDGPGPKEFQELVYQNRQEARFESA